MAGFSKKVLVYEGMLSFFFVKQLQRVVTMELKTFYHLRKLCSCFSSMRSVLVRKVLVI